MVDSKFKEDPLEFNNRTLFATNVFELLPSDHECFVYHDLLETLDTSELEKQFSVRGQKAYHPRLIIGILIYAYSHEVFSSRQIEAQCNENLGFMYISHKNCPNFRTISDFRKDNKEFFKACFKQVVRIARGAGMLSLGHVSLDGSKFKADSSKHKAMSYKGLQEAEAELMAEIEELIGEADKTDEAEDQIYGEQSGNELCEELKIKEKRLCKIQAAKEELEKREEALHPGEKIAATKQISFADKDAMIMGRKGDYAYRYNGQISVDEANQIIVGEHVSKHANDKHELKPSLEEMKDSLGQLPEKMSMDSGYLTGENLEMLCQSGIDAYVATGKGEPAVRKRDRDNVLDGESAKEGIGQVSGKIKGKFKKCHFDYEVESDQFICPMGHRLKLKTKKRRSGETVYQADRAACDNCDFYKRCCGSSKGEPRTIYSDDKEPLRQAMREKMSLESSKKIYKKRKVIVEPVFGQIKNGGFRGFHLRGFERVRGEFSLVCIVHNIKKIVRAISRGEVRLEGGKWVANGG
jgi:transposase